MLNQNFLQTLVSNTGKLLTGGTTTNLAYGQIGIFDAETYQAVTGPTYLKNKSLIFAQGTKDTDSLPKGAGIVNETEKTKTVHGRRIIGFRGTKAQRGQTMQVAIGFDGISKSKTLGAKAGDIKYLWVKLTGKPIEDIYPGGIIKRYTFDAPCMDGCTGDSCADIDPILIADSLRKKIEEDFLIASNPLKDYIRVSTITNCGTPPTPPTLVPFDIFVLKVADAGDDGSLANVQVQYPQYRLRMKTREGILTTYEAVVPDGTTLAPYVATQSPVIPNCKVCPAGYTYTAETKVFQVIVLADTPLGTLPGAVNTFKLSTDNGVDTYEVHTTATQNSATFETAVAALPGGQSNYLGISRDICALSGDPTEIPWTAAGTCNKAEKKWEITLKDSECGTSLLTSLKARYEPVYGIGSVVELSADAAHCVRRYGLTTASSNCEAADCSEDTFQYDTPAAYQGISWEPAAPVASGTDCVAGLLFESALVKRGESKCYYDIFPYEVDGIHIQLSEHDPDHHGSPCADDWPVTVIREFKYPAGNGRYVARLEEASKAYHFKYFSDARHLPERLAELQDLVTDLNSFYDQYSLIFEFKWSLLGWSDTYTDTYQINFFFPEGQGKEFERAVNSYITSTQIALDPVIL